MNRSNTFATRMKASILAPLAMGLMVSLPTITVSTAAHAAGKSAKVENLFSSQTNAGELSLPEKAVRNTSKAVSINRSAMRKGRFTLYLPNGVSFKVEREMQEDLGNGQSTWVGHAKGDKSNRVVIAMSDDAFAGTFTYQGRLFKLEPRPDGKHVVSEVSPLDPAPEHDPIPVYDARSGGSETTSGDATSGDSGDLVIDVLVAYTSAVKARYGEAGAKALVLQAVAETNQAYANSGIKTRLNLVHSTAVDYDESDSMLTDLSRLRSTNDNHLDELHTLRDTYGADLVSLIASQPGYCGLAYRMTYLSPSFASSAFSVIHHSCATGYYSFGHELGHNQGLHHDIEAAGSSRSLYPYAYGYQEPFASFRTIMAYNCQGGCKRVNHFSNPDVNYKDKPTGIDGAADNARTIDESAPIVANFRQSVTVQLAPEAPSSLHAENLVLGRVSLTWVDNADDESGYRIERAVDGGAFSTIASLPENSTEFLDTNLDSDTTYSYRVRAWNNTGVSEAAGEVSVVTDPLPPGC